MSGEIESKIGEIIAGKYKLVDVLGIGTFAVVFFARNVCTRERFALKCLFKKGLTQEQLELQKFEVQVHEMLGIHPNLVSLRDVVETSDATYLVLDYCKDDLYNVITKTTGLEESKIRNWFIHIVNAVSYMHSKGIYHRDLKPENILLGIDDTVKVADFGLATLDKFSVDLGVGSLAYVAPESIDESLDGYYAAPADVFALALILVNMKYGYRLWKSADPSDPYWMEFATDPQWFFENRFPSFSKSFRNFLQYALHPDPNQRMTLSEMKSSALTLKFTDEQETFSAFVPSHTPELTPSSDITVEDEMDFTVFPFDDETINTSKYIPSPVPSERSSSGISHYPCAPSIAPVDIIANSPFQLESIAKCRSESTDSALGASLPISEMDGLSYYLDQIAI